MIRALRSWKPRKTPEELLKIDLRKEGVEAVPSKPTRICRTRRISRPLRTDRYDDSRLCWLRHCSLVLRPLVFGFLERVPCKDFDISSVLKVRTIKIKNLRLTWTVWRQTPETPRSGGALMT